MRLYYLFCFNYNKKTLIRLVARQAHNLKVVGSNPTPATNQILNLDFLLSFKKAFTVSLVS